MRIALVIVVGALAFGAVAVWKLQAPPLKSCTVLRSVSANAPNDRYVAHVETRTCDRGLKAGLFVVVEKATEPGALYEAFYSSRNPPGVTLRWSDERELEIALPVPLEAAEQAYDGQSVAGSVAIRLKAAGEVRGTGS
jgi:hypothetical protein